MGLFKSRQVNRMGEYTDEPCKVCRETNYKLTWIRTYLCILGMPIAPYRSEYRKVCTGCEDTTTLEKYLAHDVMDKHMSSEKARLRASLVGRYVLLGLVAFVAILIGVLSNIENKDVTVTEANDAIGIDGVKAMVHEDGNYQIYNPDGKILANVTVEDGKKRVNNLLEYWEYNDPAITNGREYTAVYYYYERGENEAALVEDEAMIICDEHIVGVRYHWYDNYEDELGWSYGVEDFNDIQYKADRIIYPMQGWVSETEYEYYSKVRVEDGNTHVVTTFYHGKDNSLNEVKLVDVTTTDPVAHSEDRRQYYKPMAITPDSTVKEILACIEDNDYAYDYRYYEVLRDGVGEITVHFENEWINQDTEEMNEAKGDYEVTRHENGFYIAKLKE